MSDSKLPTFVYCNACMKELDNVLTCSRCKNATYCSKECQIKHWKEHKPRCKHYLEAKQSVPKREFRLFQEWRDNVRNTILLRAIARAMPSRELFLRQPSEIVFIVEVRFNCNYRTFLPVSLPPQVLTRSELPAQFQSTTTNRSTIEKNRQEWTSHDQDRSAAIRIDQDRPAAIRNLAVDFVPGSTGANYLKCNRTSQSPKTC